MFFCLIRVIILMFGGGDFDGEHDSERADFSRDEGAIKECNICAIYTKNMEDLSSL